jgi:hypothetical protein
MEQVWRRSGITPLAILERGHVEVEEHSEAQVDESLLKIEQGRSASSAARRRMRLVLLGGDGLGSDESQSCSFGGEAQKASSCRHIEMCPSSVMQILQGLGQAGAQGEAGKPCMRVVSHAVLGRKLGESLHRGSGENEKQPGHEARSNRCKDRDREDDLSERWHRTCAVGRITAGQVVLSSEPGLQQNGSLAANPGVKSVSGIRCRICGRSR